MQPTISSTLYWARIILKKNNIKNSDFEARSLLTKILAKNDIFLLTYPENTISDEQYKKYNQLIQKRLQGVPFAYLTGEKGFYDDVFTVDSQVLIPRPETEHLVDRAKFIIQKYQLKRIVELGVGSGAVILSLAKIFPECFFHGVDQSLSALKIAEKNQKKLKVSNVKWFKGNWFEPLKNNKYDLIISNPPYVSEKDYIALPDLSHEPIQALVSSYNGYADLFHIIKFSPKNLKVKGWLLLEHGANQDEKVLSYFKQNKFKDIVSTIDFSGYLRVIEGQYNLTF